MKIHEGEKKKILFIKEEVVSIAEGTFRKRNKMTPFFK